MNRTLRNLTLSAMFLALGMALPFLTGQIKEIGNMLLPMHIPVLLCGLICGCHWGAGVGLVLPLLRSVTFGRPNLFPEAVAMAPELLTYGLVVGLVYGLFRRQNLGALYCALLTAMVAGRLVWGAVMLLLLGVQGGAFTWEAFLGGAVLKAVPGIILQLVLIPLIMAALDRAGLVRFRRDD